MDGNGYEERVRLQMADSDDTVRSFCTEFNTDEENEAIRALEFVAEILPRVRDDSYYWKWAIIGLHNAVQGYMVLALRGSWPVRVYKPRDARRILQHERTDILGRFALEAKADLDFFLGLFTKVQASDQMGMYVNSRPLVPSEAQVASVERLNRLRNEVIHFVPISMTLSVAEWPAMVRDCCSIIRFLAFESGNVVWRGEDGMGAQTGTLLEMVERAAGGVDELYALRRRSRTP